MFSEACFVWNHALALQKRYYGIYGKYINRQRMRSHFAKRHKRENLHSQTVQEILERLDFAYRRFFSHAARRPPKFHKEKYFSSIVYRQGGYSLNGNILTINRIKKRYKFSLSRPYDGKIKMLTIKRDNLGEYYIIMVIDKTVVKHGKTHNGASVGIDFGLKQYMTLSDGSVVNNPLFLKRHISKIRQLDRKLSMSAECSKNRTKKRYAIGRVHGKIRNSRNDFQWKLAHSICRKYDNIFIEDLNIYDMRHRWGRKITDLSHTNFVLKLQYVATKYDVNVHKINRYYASSKTCNCGYVNNELRLSDRKWTCPSCGQIHDRDLLAARNILRQGIAEMESERKTLQYSTVGIRVCIHESHP
jgi:putative transposase